MKAFMISAMQSGAGKTVMSCALMSALKRKGLHVQAFKSGPDYIDPMFHTRVLGVESRNLDLFLQGRDGVRRSFETTVGDVTVIEGAMGYYDGLQGGTGASAWELASLLRLPCFLVLRPGGAGTTLCAQVQGMLSFREESRICGLLLCDCAERRAESVKTMLERECGLPVLGWLPPMEEARLESRHLGLMTAAEVSDFSGRFARLGEQVLRTVDLDRLLSLAAEFSPAAPEMMSEPVYPAADSCHYRAGNAETDEIHPARCRIAVARDEAFCFLYAENLEALRQAGARLVFFSPLRDRHLPACDGLLLCGGYPELHATELAENESLRREIREWVRAGRPTVAECGGLLYLQESLEDANGSIRPMCGALPGSGFRTDRLQRFGYLTLTAEEDSLLLRRGEHVPAHEFHYWDSTEPGTALKAGKTDGRSWRCAYTGERLYAAFPHLHFGGELPMAERFVKACER